MIVPALLALGGCEPALEPPSGRDMDLRSSSGTIAAPFIPAPCYANTGLADGGARTPCWTCHQQPRAPNFVRDEDLQLAYAMPAPAAANPWTNLLAPARPPPSADEIVAWIRDDNWLDDDGSLSLARALRNLPDGWDSDGDGSWDGFVPDLWFAADEGAWDHAPDGALTGWRSYVYHPLPGAFWPTNGSWGDAWIRLPEVYRQDPSGAFDLAVYEANLALVESLAQRTVVGWAPREGQGLRWAGRAGVLQDDGQVGAPIVGLLPVGTELSHSVRYVDPTDDGRVQMAARLKELRYARKTTWQTWAALETAAAMEAKERHDFPDRLKSLHGDLERGVFTGGGWLLQGFVEDARGELRPQTVEETSWCVGCHGGIAATTDGTFSLARKVPGDAGWRHDRAGLYGLPDLARADGRCEAALYLETTGSGDDFAANEEIRARYFDADGALLEGPAAALATDLSPLVLPSPERALALNAVSMEVARTQSFVRGREPVRGLDEGQLWRRVPVDDPTGWEEPVAPNFVRVAH